MSMAPLPFLAYFFVSYCLPINIALLLKHILPGWEGGTVHRLATDVGMMETWPKNRFQKSKLITHMLGFYRFRCKGQDLDRAPSAAVSLELI